MLICVAVCIAFFRFINEGDGGYRQKNKARLADCQDHSRLLCVPLVFPNISIRYRNINYITLGAGVHINVYNLQTICQYTRPIVDICRHRHRVIVYGILLYRIQ